ncbi:hypothetical protein CHS0354_038253 [Potamilus streckersoni]|uniref:Uncharacterized protein n=1 Tax=Potamilus streckersoni TaxID=2493646 RepID=A0AAE0T198_9BIVA|nr:hypothetical protein CHS0354_038253 [Potamilus streckersoni]
MSLDHEWTKGSLHETQGPPNPPVDQPDLEVEEHLRKAHSDPGKEKDLGDQHRLIIPDVSVVLADSSEPRLQELKDIIKDERATSVPGPRLRKTVHNCPEEVGIY